MHLGEALMTREDAVRLAADELRRAVERNAAYYAKKPETAPNPDRPLVERISALDTWIFVPFARVGGDEDPVVLRVNGVTKAVALEPKTKRK